MSCSRSDKKNAFFHTWCYDNLDTTLTSRCRDIEPTNDGWGPIDVGNFEPARVNNQFWQKSGTDVKGNSQSCRTGSHGNCEVKTPFEKDKYGCCAGTETRAVKCGPEWCPSDANCTTFWNNYCSGDKLVDDENCFKKFKTTKATEIGQICSKFNKFRTKNCKEFCDSQYTTGGSSFSYCLSGADTFCKANPTDPACGCIEFKNGSQYKNIQSKMSPGLSLNAYQCWSSACATRGTPTWSSKLTTEAFNGCSGTYQFCGQSLDVGSLKADSVGKIEQACTLNNTNNQNLINAPAPAPASTPDPTSNNAPTTPPPPETSPSIDFTAISKSPITYITSGVMLLFCCLIVIFIIMSKRK
jgi:hypothetical protein